MGGVSGGGPAACRPERGGSIVRSTTDIDDPAAIDLVQRNLTALREKRRTQGLKPVEEVRYHNLCEILYPLLHRQAS